MKSKFLAIFLLCCTCYLFSEQTERQATQLQKAHQAATKGFWQQCYNLLDSIPVSEQTEEYKLLLSEAKIMLNIGTEADESYIFQNGSFENQLNLYLRNGQFQKVIQLATQKQNLTQNEKYILGLAYLSEHDFANAEKNLGTDSVFAHYYTAYAQYLQNKTSDALQNFIQITQKYPAHYLAIESYLYSAKCCITMNNTASAIQYAKQALNRTENKLKKFEAALFLTGIYIEQKAYINAIDILKPLTNSFDINSVPVRFRLADIYFLNNELAKADKLLEDTLKYFSDSEYGAEAAFRRGEIFYKSNDFLTASKHFEYCRTNFPFGEYYAQALYYSTLCSQKLNSNGTSINQTEKQIVLIDANEIKRKYEQNNKANSTEGRKIGVELASIYLNSENDTNEGINILKSILSKISENSTNSTDLETAAKANYLLGINKCVNAEFILGSEFYIKAANFYSGIDDNLAAESLYKATQALYNAKNTTDATLVLQKMQNLFASSSWTAKANALLNGGNTK